jgi:hypothetical protein
MIFSTYKNRWLFWHHLYMYYDSFNILLKLIKIHIGIRDLLWKVEWLFWNCKHAFAYVSLLLLIVALTHHSSWLSTCYGPLWDCFDTRGLQPQHPRHCYTLVYQQWSYHRTTVKDLSCIFLPKNAWRMPKLLPEAGKEHLSSQAKRPIGRATLTWDFPIWSLDWTLIPRRSYWGCWPITYGCSCY